MCVTAYFQGDVAMDVLVEAGKSLQKRKQSGGNVDRGSECPN